MEKYVHSSASGKIGISVKRKSIDSISQKHVSFKAIYKFVTAFVKLKTAISISHTFSIKIVRT